MRKLSTINVAQFTLPAYGKTERKWTQLFIIISVTKSFSFIAHTYYYYELHIIDSIHIYNHNWVPWKYLVKYIRHNIKISL